MDSKSDRNSYMIKKVLQQIVSALYLLFYSRFDSLLFEASIQETLR